MLIIHSQLILDLERIFLGGSESVKGSVDKSLLPIQLTILFVLLGLVALFHSSLFSFIVSASSFFHRPANEKREYVPLLDYLLNVVSKVT